MSKIGRISLDQISEKLGVFDATDHGKYNNLLFDQTFRHDQQSPQSSREHVAKTWDYEEGTASQNLYVTTHKHMYVKKTCVELQSNDMNTTKDMMKTSNDFEMVQKTDMLMARSQTNVDEKEICVTGMLYDMLPTKSVTDTMGGGDSVVETTNKEFTSCATDYVWCRS